MTLAIIFDCLGTISYASVAIAGKDFETLGTVFGHVFGLLLMSGDEFEPLGIDFWR